MLIEIQDNTVQLKNIFIKGLQILLQKFVLILELALNRVHFIIVVVHIVDCLDNFVFDGLSLFLAVNDFVDLDACEQLVILVGLNRSALIGHNTHWHLRDHGLHVSFFLSGRLTNRIVLRVHLLLIAEVHASLNPIDEGISALVHRLF